MIIDCHTHVWQHPAELGLPLDAAGEPLAPLAADVSDHMEAMRPVDLAFVWGFASRRLGVEIPVPFLGQHVGLRSNARVGLIGIDPSDPAWRDKLLEAVDEWAFQGVALSPACQDLHPLDARNADLYELCRQRNLPVGFDLPPRWQPTSTLAFARPELLDNVAREFPGLRIIISGFGYPFVDETLVLLEKFDTVFADTAHLVQKPLALAQALTKAHQAGCLGKVLFGSGFPFMRPDQALAAVYRQRSSLQTPPEYVLPEEAVSDLVHRDALAVLGIARPEGFAPRDDPPPEDTVDDE